MALLPTGAGVAACNNYGRGARPRVAGATDALVALGTVSLFRGNCGSVPPSSPSTIGPLSFAGVEENGGSAERNRILRNFS